MPCLFQEIMERLLRILTRRDQSRPILVLQRDYSRRFRRLEPADRLGTEYIEGEALRGL